MEKLKWVYRFGFIVSVILGVLIYMERRKGAEEIGRFEIEHIEEENETISVIDFVSNDQTLEKVKELKNCLLIPSIDVEAVIHEGVTSDAIATGVGHYSSTKKIGQDGNACYTGHYSTRFNCVFNKLPDIALGAEIEAYNASGKKTSYYVVKKYIVNPTDAWVLNDCVDKKLTIITCANNGTQRLVVECMGYSKEQLTQIKESAKQVTYDGMDEVLSTMGDVSICNYIKHRGRILKVIYPIKGSISPNVGERFLLNVG